MIQQPSTEELELLLGEQLRAERLRANVTQAALARRAGVALSSVRRIEAGASGASVATLVRVLRALGREDWLSSLQPPVTISPLQMLKTGHSRRRARSARGAPAGGQMAADAGSNAIG
jgi:transcriptional regulator with XRE-family HTH domain